MNAKEFFNDSVLNNFGHSCSYGDWTKSYWDLEFVSAEMNDCAFTNFDEWGDKRSRTCEVCGTENHTNESGFVSFCSDNNCAEVRSYFGFTSGARPHLASGKKGSVRDQRVAWLRKKLKDLYAVNSIYHADEIPLDCRLPLLISMMIAREQIEHQRTSGDAGEATCIDAREPKQREQTENHSAYGSSCSVY